MLGVIDKGSCSDAHPVPLLFVHGGWHGAWCWDDHFLDFFAAAGYRAVALSLRGHAPAPAPKRVRKVPAAAYPREAGAPPRNWVASRCSSAIPWAASWFS